MNSSSTDSRRDDDLPPLPPFNPNAPPNPPSIRSLPSTSNSHRTSLSPSSINDELKLFINKASKLAVQLDTEKRRADDAERRLNEVLIRFKAVNDARIAAIHESRRANSELELYKLQLETAQREIIRAQEVADALERQRFQAEKDAAEARSRLRRLNEKTLIDTAREEGRRRGLQQGLQRGRELGVTNSHPTGYQESHLEADTLLDDGSLYDSVPRYSTAPTSRRQSVADSQRQSRTPPDSGRHAPTPTSRPPALPSSTTPPLSPPPVPIPPPDIVPHASSIPRHVVNTAPMMTPRTTHPYEVPPDNYIPITGPDNIIRVPPAHEFQRPPATPEQLPPPQLPVGSETSSAAHPNTPQHIYRAPHHSSPASNSTTLSQLDILDNPHNINMRTPMSIIPEVPSPSVQNLSRTGSLRHQPSMSGSSVHRTSLDPSASADTRQQALYTRPFSVSSSISSSQPARGAESSAGHGHSSTSTLVPDINIQPPSNRTSLSAQQRTDDNVQNRHPGQHWSFSDPPLSSFSNAEQPIRAPSPATNMGMPGGLPDSYIMRESHISTGEGPVIPAPELMQSHASDSDVASSQGSRNTLSTPPEQHREQKEPYADTLRTLRREPIYSSSQHRYYYGRDPLFNEINAMERNNVLLDSIRSLEESDSEDSEGKPDSLRTESTTRRERTRMRRKAKEEAREQLAAHVPLPPSTVHGTPRSIYSAVSRQTPAGS
ncbi:hypothetical protein BDQ17DRAFT_1365679 [Cyathus striatus]|nr:hypothetical protein BDQ17DRAFT_1365679 [Cyathus striatus]